MALPEFLVVGHICKDIIKGKFRLGGTAAYAALTARNLGKRAAVVTAVESGLELDLDGVALHRVRSTTTTTFENIYHDGQRLQYLHAVARRLGLEDIPAEWREVPLVHLGPIAQEVGEELVEAFPKALIGVTPQGWMRTWDDRGRVLYCEWRAAERLLPRVSVVIFSEEDAPKSDELARRYSRLTEIVVVTRAERGATVYRRGKPYHFPTRPAREVDPTGAGDVFAAAYLIRYYETDDPYEAAQFANLVASFSVEAPGMEGIPTRDEVFTYLNLKRRRITCPSPRRGFPR